MRNILSVLAGSLLYIPLSVAQLHGNSDVTASMDLQPILTLNTNVNNVEFVFNDLTDYSAGITQYGATILKVTSTVNWDLYAVAASSGNVGQGYWDVQSQYGNTATGATNKIPLSALEIHQQTPNRFAAAATGTYKDYSAPFPPIASPSGSNSVYVDLTNSGLPPQSNHKYIAGHAGITGVGNDAVAGGSYLNTSGGSSDFYYALDYRIVPGVPAVFPMAYQPDGVTPMSLTATQGANTYLQPGIYTMSVQFILLEDQ